MAKCSVFKFMSYAIHGPQLIIVNGKHHFTISLAGVGTADVLI